MTDISYNKLISMSDKALSEQIGAFVKHNRLEQNRTQEELSRAAGISRSTLSLLEHGETVTIATLIQVLRILDRLHFMESFTIQKTISPLALLRQEHGKRKRARGKKGENIKGVSW
jgi:transcriptional regulator with XRE-family HTH domain